MKNIRDLDVNGKKVLIRVDFNVPMDESGNITDDIRMRRALPTIEYALKNNAKVIIASHFGRPKGQRVDKFSLAPVAAHLAELLATQVKITPDCIGRETEEVINAMQPGDVVLLENLRFYTEETKNDSGFAASLAALTDIYINDAFAVSHRAHASVVGIPEHCKECGAGFLLQKEMDYFHRSMDNPTRPLVALVGGAKVSSKLRALENMLDKVDRMLIGGAMANTFLKSLGYDVGDSKVEDDLLDAAHNFMDKAKAKGVKIYLPVDVIAADSFAPDAVTKQVTIQDIPSGWMALDVGPATVIQFQEAIADAKTIIWNGPIGAFEMDAFSRGTMAMVSAVAASHALSITGGGDSNAAVNQSGEADNISYMSTGGGAFLMLMEGKVLPGVAALES